MVFKRLLGAMGLGGPSVETELANPNCRPGGRLEGLVRVAGGGEDPIDVEYVAIGLITRVDGVEQEFHRQRLTGSFRLDPEARHEIGFEFAVPWETPITEVYGQRLHGMTMGLSTELEVARAVEKSDLDDVAVHPLPAQERILDALLRLGFRFTRAAVERGRTDGVRQRLPFRQDIAFAPPAAYASAIEELSVTFLPTPEIVQVVFAADPRVPRGRAPFGHFDVDPVTVDGVDWMAQVDAWLRGSAVRRGVVL